MKKSLLPIASGIILGVIGFLVGMEIGIRNTEEKFEQRSIGEIKLELNNRESMDITQFLDGKAKIERINDGSFFSPKYVQYLTGNIENSATVTSAKDVILAVDYFSKTGTRIGGQEITIYEFIRPHESIEFKEKISVPEKVEDFEFRILKAVAE